MQQPSRQAIAKRVETLTVINRTMGVIQVNPFPAKLFPPAFAFKLKSINILKGGRGERVVETSFIKWKMSFRKKKRIFDAMSQPFCNCL